MEQIINLNELGYTETLKYSEIDAISELMGAGGTGYDSITNTITLYTHTVDILLTKELIEAKAKELEDKKTLEDTKKRINGLCTNLTNRIKEFLTYKNVTSDQEERYKVKREAALKADISAFTLEAELLGKDPVDLMNYVRDLTIQWEETSNMALLKIDAFRVKLNSILATDTNGITIFMLDYLEANISTLKPDVDVVALFNTMTDGFVTYLADKKLKEEQALEELEEVDLGNIDNPELVSFIAAQPELAIQQPDTVDQEDLVYEEPNNQG